MVKTIRQLVSEVMSRASFASQAGLTFTGKRDLYAALGYKRKLTSQDYRDRYDRGDIAASIVDAYPDATWRGPGELVEDEDPNVSTVFEETWNELNKRLGIWSTFRQADILAGLGRFSVILLGVPGKFEEEVTPFSAEQLFYLTPLSEMDVSVKTFEVDSQSQRFGLPLLYSFKRLGASADGRSLATERIVHHSRVLHIVTDSLDDAVYGVPRLQRVWNRLDDLDKVAGGGAEAFWKRVYQGLQLDIDKDLELSEDGLTDLKEQVDELEHGMRRIFRTRGVTLNELTSDVTDFSKPIDAIITLLAGATRIPKRILVGSEQGELASSQDENNWDDRVADRRTGFAETRIVRPFVDRLIAYKALPAPKQYGVRWPEIENLDERGQAEVALKLAEVNRAAGETVITADEIRDRCLGLPPLEEIDELPDDERDENED